MKNTRTEKRIMRLWFNGQSIADIERVSRLKRDFIFSVVQPRVSYAITNEYVNDQILKAQIGVSLGRKREPYYPNENDYGVKPKYSVDQLSESELEIANG